MSTAVDAGELDFSSIESAGSGLRTLEIPPESYGTAIGDALALSERRAHLLARGILETADSESQRRHEMNILVTWARDAGSEQRRVVSRAIRTSGEVPALLDHVSGMERDDARAFVADYFESGGSTRPVAHWLRDAGAMLNAPETHLKDGETSPSESVSGGATVLTASATIQSIFDAIGRIVDAVVSAGKAIREVIGDVVGWAIDEVADLINALIEAGRDLGEILSEAVSESLSLMRKFVRAAIEAGKAVGDVMSWAVEQSSDALRHAISALQSAGRNLRFVLSWAADQATGVMTKVIESIESMGNTLGDLLRWAVDSALGVLDAVVEGLLALNRTIGDILTAAINHFRRLLDRTVEALLNLDETIGTILSAARDVATSTVKAVSSALVTVGQRAMDLIAWASDQVASVARTVVEGILEAGRSAIGVLRSAAAATLEHTRVVLDALLVAGRSFVRVVGRFLTEDIPILSTVIKAGLELGQRVGDLVSDVINRTYRTAARLVDAALEAGATVADILATVANETYWNLRQIVNGIVRAGAPIRTIMEWVAERASSVGDQLWRRALLAIRYAGGRLQSALDWAIDASRDAFEAVLRAWESIREPIYTAYEWARTAGEFVWETIGQVTEIIGNSVSYVLNYLANNYLQGINAFVMGVLKAGYKVGKLVVRIAGITLEAAVRAVTAMLAFGVTLTTLLVETAANPRAARKNLVDAIREAGQTLDDIYDAVKDARDHVVEAVTLALNDLKESIDEILDAAFEIGAGLLSTIIAVLVRTLGTYRRLTSEERQDARIVYEDAIDLDTVRISTESRRNRIIFGIQKWFQERFTDDDKRRPFVTMNLINFDTRGGIHRHTFVHELMHVWQADHIGPVYMAHAILEQGSDDAYNYGYLKDSDPGYREIEIPSDYVGGTVKRGTGFLVGEGGEDVLDAADGDLKEFNIEQQAQIMMHYFVRKEFVDPSEDSVLRDLDPFVPYVEAIRSA